MRARWALIAAALLLGAVLAALASAPPAAPGGPAARAEAATGVASGSPVRTRSGRVRGAHLRVRKRARAPRPPRSARRWWAARRNRPPQRPGPEDPAEVVDPPSAPPAGTRAGGFTAGIPGVNVIRNTFVIRGANSLGATVMRAEPTVANDEHVSLVTGNHFVGVSEDNGLTYDDFLATDELLPASLPGSGFCCDQTATEVDRPGGHSLTFWVAKALDDGNANTIQVAVFDGRDDQLEDDSLDEGDVCTFDFPTSAFNLGNDRELDYPQVAASSGYLYFTAVAFDIPDPGDKPRFITNVGWRVSLDTIEDECDEPVPSPGYSWFTNDDADNPLAPVRGAGSTMYLAQHRDSATSTDRIHIFKWPDGSGLSEFEANISNWPRIFKVHDCPVDGGNPCGYNDGRLHVGYRAGDTVGWVWTSAQGKGFAHPHVRAVAFDTDDLTDPVMDTQLYSDSYAITYPAVGPSSANKVGLVYYRMGGTKRPEAVALIGDPRDLSPDGALSTAVVGSSTHTPAADKWGDYSSVRKYDGCEETFLAGFHLMKNGTGDDGVEVHTTWFGQPGGGCPDYDISSLSFTTEDGNRNADVGDEMTINATTRNSGSATPETQSRTAFYLSRDPFLGNGDFRFETTHVVDPLLPLYGDAFSEQFTVPNVRNGDWYVLACADDKERIDDEISEENNCQSDPRRDVVGSLLTVSGYTGAPVGDLELTVGSRPLVRAAATRYRLPVRITGRGVSARDLRRVGVTVDIAPVRGFRRPGLRVPLTAADADAPVTGSRQSRTLGFRLPRRARSGRYYLRACLLHPRGREDEVWRNDCAITRRPVSLRP